MATVGTGAINRTLAATITGLLTSSIYIPEGQWLTLNTACRIGYVAAAIEIQLYTNGAWVTYERYTS